MHHARRLTLRLAPDGSEVRITLPRLGRGAEAIAFAHSRADWLAGQLAKLPARTAPEPGGTVQYRGAALTLAWEASRPAPPAACR